MFAVSKRLAGFCEDSDRRSSMPSGRARYNPSPIRLRSNTTSKAKPLRSLLPRNRRKRHRCNKTIASREPTTKRYDVSQLRVQRTHDDVKLTPTNGKKTRNAAESRRRHDGTSNDAADSYRRRRLGAVRRRYRTDANYEAATTTTKRENGNAS